METQPPNTGYFVKAFEKYRKSFVVIGGTAALLHIEERLDKKPRKTDDLDIVVLDISEDGTTSPFLTEFVQYVKHCEYECKPLSTGKAQAYRFTKPKDPLAPAILEIATRRELKVEFPAAAQRLESFEMSAIVCEPHYIDLLKVHVVEMVLNDKGDERLTIPKIPLLVVMKAYAYKNLKGSSDARDQNKAEKHLRDVIRLSAAMNAGDTLTVPGAAFAPLEELLQQGASVFSPQRLSDCEWQSTAEELVLLLRDRIKAVEV